MPKGVYQHKPHQLFQKGNKYRRNLGYKHTDETKKKIGLSQKKRKNNKGKKHYLWKGDKVGYSRLHFWIRRWKGKANHCEICGATDKQRYQWANIDHKYRRVFKDYIPMCVSCHDIYDILFNNKKHTK